MYFEGKTCWKLTPLVAQGLRVAICISSWAWDSMRQQRQPWSSWSWHTRRTELLWVSHASWHKTRPAPVRLYPPAVVSTWNTLRTHVPRGNILKKVFCWVCLGTALWADTPRSPVINSQIACFAAGLSKELVSQESWGGWCQNSVRATEQTVGLSRSSPAGSFLTPVERLETKKRDDVNRST